MIENKCIEVDNHIHNTQSDPNNAKLNNEQWQALIALHRTLLHENHDEGNAPPYQVGIQFFQVGNKHGAAEDLQELDNSLAGKVDSLRDMVDTVT